MKNLLFIIILTLSLTACKKETKTNDPEPELIIEPNTKALVFNTFTIRVPDEWSSYELQGIDSYVGGIATGTKDSIRFDYGWYSNSLDVEVSNHTITYTTINSKKAKIVQPVNNGLGTTGVYFEKTDNTNMNRLQISGQNLNADTQKKFLTAIRTIRF